MSTALKATEFLMMNECVTFQTDTLNLQSARKQLGREPWVCIDARPYFWPCVRCLKHTGAYFWLIPHPAISSTLDLEPPGLPIVLCRQPHSPRRMRLAVNRQMGLQASCCRGPSKRLPDSVLSLGKSSLYYCLNSFLLTSKILIFEETSTHKLS